MENYYKKVLRGFLDKEPDCYKIPPRKTSESIQEVKSLLPTISKVELHLHKHPNGQELAVVINGDNLWFCSILDVKISRNKSIFIEISPKHITEKQICYNHSVSATFSYADIDGDDVVHVTVYSRFANTFSQYIPVFYNVSWSIVINKSYYVPL